LTLIGRTGEAEPMKMLIGGLLIALMADGAAEAHYNEHPKGFFFHESPEPAQMSSPFSSGGGGGEGGEGGGG